MSRFIAGLLLMFFLPFSGLASRLIMLKNTKFGKGPKNHLRLSLAIC